MRRTVSAHGVKENECKWVRDAFHRSINQAYTSRWLRSAIASSNCWNMEIVFNLQALPLICSTWYARKWRTFASASRKFWVDDYAFRSQIGWSHPINQAYWSFATQKIFSNPPVDTARATLLLPRSTQSERIARMMCTKEHITSRNEGDLCCCSFPPCRLTSATIQWKVRPIVGGFGCSQPQK